MNSLECSKIVDSLQKHLKQVSYNSDLYKMLDNLNKMVTEISKLEVISRQRKNNSILEKPIKDFLESADRLEKLILIAKLLD